MQYRAWLLVGNYLTSATVPTVQAGVLAPTPCPSYPIRPESSVTTTQVLQYYYEQCWLYNINKPEKRAHNRKIILIMVQILYFSFQFGCDTIGVEWKERCWETILHGPLEFLHILWHNASYWFSSPGLVSNLMQVLLSPGPVHAAHGNWNFEEPTQEKWWYAGNCNFCE